LAVAKCNLCERPPTLEYAIADGRLGWIGATDIPAAELTGRRTAKGHADDDSDAAAVRRATAKLLAALDHDGMTDKQARDLARISGRDMASATKELLGQGKIERVSITVRCGKGQRPVDGLRLAHRDIGTSGLPV
jgi:hypothetical protein